METFVVVSITVKKFCSLINNSLERLLDDFHANSKFSTDIRQALKKICIILNISIKNYPNIFITGCYLLIIVM